MLRNFATMESKKISHRSRKQTLKRRYGLVLSLGIAILLALAIGDCGSKASQHQDFSAPAHSDSFLPETVRIESP